MLQQDHPGDYVVATGVGATVKDFVRASFEAVGLEWEKFVEQDARYERPTEVQALIGDPLKAREQLKWSAKTYWKDLAKIMVDADLDLIQGNR
jgi:GDPmannose 4,6-dehydratase